MNKLVYSLLAVGGLAINADAALVAGTEIGIDFGPTAPTNNFNQAAATAAYGSGNLVITGTGTAPRPDIPVIAALQLTAVPEPSITLLGALGLLALLRRRRS